MFMDDVGVPRAKTQTLEFTDSSGYGTVRYTKAASSKRLEVRQHPVEPVSELARVTAEEAHRILQAFGLAIRAAAAGVRGVTAAVLRRAALGELPLFRASARRAGSTGGVDPTHHVAHESLPAGASALRSSEWYPHPAQYA